MAVPPQAPATATREATRSRGVERWFYINVALFIILLSAISFGPSIIDQSRRNAPSLLVTAHGIVLIAWLLLFLTQAALVATGRTSVHRRLGLLGPVLAVAVIVLSYLVLIDFGRRGYDLSGDVMHALSRKVAPRHTPPGLLFPLAELLNFGVLVAAGLWCRRRPDVHKRLMLMAAIVLASEPMLHLVGHLSSRWPALRGAGVVISIPLTFLLLFSSAIYDRVSRGRIHPVSLWVPILLFAWQTVLASVVFPSSTWRELSAWLVR